MRECAQQHTEIIFRTLCRCALQYILLHLVGFKLSIDDLKSFRQLGSLTPGHPEAGHTDGIEVTTGPLGQGFANAVGLGIAQAHMAAVYNKEGFDLINNYTYGKFTRRLWSPPAN